MAVFEFLCRAGHTTEVYVSLAKRPKRITCACGQRAKFVLSATPTTFRQNDRRAFKRLGH